MIKKIKSDLCVVGGGLAGLCAAISASRKGLKVVLVHDRPVLGGNASSEIRMWVRGASVSFPEYREGGIVEELAMDNMYYNPYQTFPLWDGVLYNKAISEKNLTLLMNTTCNGAEYKDNKIKCVKAWQLTTYTNFEICADYFADCSGDSVLSQFIPAEITSGRESFDMFHESGAKEVADNKTMGNSCLIQCRETTHEVPCIPFPFVYKFKDEDFNYRMNISAKDGFLKDNFWWLEKGGNQDTIKDAEVIKDELLKRSFGAWDYIKNSGKFDSGNWELSFAGFLGGKRENRRYIGDYVLTQNDLEQAKEFKDEIAYGGWTMDDHNPDGIDTNAPPNVHYRIKNPYPIPLRCIYSKNIENLFFAGRNISATHLAISSTRVMATCALLGQAVGSAAYVAKKYKLNSKQLLGKTDELKQILRNEDCFLLNTPRKLSYSILNSENNLSDKDFNVLKSGIERKIGDKDPVLELNPNQEIEFEFENVYCESVRLLFDNDIARNSYTDYDFKQYPMKCNTFLNETKYQLPECLIKNYEISVKVGDMWRVIAIKDNHTRLNLIPIREKITGLKFKGISTYGLKKIRLYSIDIL